MAEITESLELDQPESRRSALRSWPIFVAIGLLLYAGLYVWAERLVLEHGERNRFHMIATAPSQTYDHVILGASHAMPLGYDDFGDRLEAASGASIMNLSIEGAGILPNRLVLDYFLARHATRNVVFVLDSFAFYSPQWNEERLDASLFARAPLDPDLVATLWRHDWARALIVPYASGFTKINDQKRFEPDRSDAELSKFHRTYRAIPQIDSQRVAYLYPAEISAAVFQRYLGEFEALIDMVEAHGARFIIVRPPTPARYRDLLPEEARFDAAIAELVGRRGLSYRDFSTALPGDENYYDTDHLNPTGVEALIAGGLADLLASAR